MLVMGIVALLLLYHMTKPPPKRKGATTIKLLLNYSLTGAGCVEVDALPTLATAGPVAT